MIKIKNYIMIFAQKLQKLKDNYEKNKKWKLYLYLNGQCIEAYNYFGAHFVKREVETEILVPLKASDTNSSTL